MSNKTFTFTTQNPKASRYLLLCLLSFVSIFGMFFLPIVVLFILMFGFMALGFILFISHSKRVEEITLYEDHLDSEVYGVVYFEDIISAKPVTIDTGEGLKLKLADKKKIWWKAIKTDELPIYNAFVATLSEAVSEVDLSQVKGAALKTNDPQEIPSNATEETKAKEPEPSTEKVNLREEISQVQHKNQNAGHAKTILLVATGILLALYGLFKIYAPKWEQQRNEREMAPLRQGIMENMDKKAELRDSAATVMHQYARAHGPYYLYTNDTSAQVIYLPRLNIREKTQTGITSLVANDGTTEKLKAFLEHPDSTQWDVAVMNPYTSFRLLDRVLDTYFTKDSAETYVYLGVMNLKADSDRVYGEENKVYRAGFYNGSVVPLDPKGHLEAQISKNAGAFLDFVKNNPKTSRFYVAASGEEGKMDKQLFKKIIEILKEGLVYKNIDTTNFVTKTFEE